MQPSRLWSLPVLAAALVGCSDAVQVSAPKRRVAVAQQQHLDHGRASTAAPTMTAAPPSARSRQGGIVGRFAKRAPTVALGLGTAALFGTLPAFAAPDMISTTVAAGGPLDSGFVQATSLIFLSEIGDKTFFIASILAAKASRIITFVGAFGALALMTIISVIIGQIFHAVPESLTGGLPLDDYVAIASFVYFGLKSIADAVKIDGETGGDGLDDEFREAEAELESGAVLERTRGRALALAGEAFALTVAAEIGDRSQIATIALSAAQNPYIVCGGACLGHGLATGIAVVGGSFISKYVNEKGILLIAGSLFLVFAATTAFPLVFPAVV